MKKVSTSEALKYRRVESTSPSNTRSSFSIKRLNRIDHAKRLRRESFLIE